MIALSILAIGIIAVSKLHDMAIRGNASSKWKTAATSLAEEKMEELKTGGYSGLSNTTWTAAETITLTGTGEYSRQYQISDSVAGFLKLIEVRVSWTGPGGGNKQVDLSTFLAKN